MGKRTCFIKYSDFGFGELFKMIAALDHNAAAAGPADPAKKAERYRNDQRTGTAYHQKAQCTVTPYGPITPK